jgi:hypothetical protein
VCVCLEGRINLNDSPLDEQRCMLTRPLSFSFNCGPAVPIIALLVGRLDQVTLTALVLKIIRYYRFQSSGSSPPLWNTLIIKLISITVVVKTTLVSARGFLKRTRLVHD